jgi:hypothetical protein
MGFGGLWAFSILVRIMVKREYHLRMVFENSKPIATSGVFQYTPRAWVSGEKAPHDLRERRRGVLVRALYREDVIYSKGTPSPVDAAFELLAPCRRALPPQLLQADGLPSKRS